MFKGGRPKKLVWQAFTMQGDKKAQCKQCFHILSAKVERLTAHHDRCSGKSTPEKRPASSMYSMCEDKVSTLSPPKKKRQLDLTGHFVTTSSVQKQDLDQKLADLLFATNTPFNFVEHPIFKEFCNMMRPGYIPPTAKQIGGPLLENSHNRLKSILKQELEGKPTTIQQDGWTNIKEDPIIATSLTTHGKGYFNDAHDPGAEKKTADLCSELLLASIKTAETQYGCEVLNCCTDNENKMIKTRELVLKERPDINVYGCMSHNLNLLCKDVCKPSIMQQVKSVNHHFKHVHRCHGWLRDYSGHVKPQMLCATRWNSGLDCLKSYLTNHPFYKKIATDHADEMDPNIVRRIKDIGLLSAAEDLYEKLKPITGAINKCQSDSCMIADATHHYLSLLSKPCLKSHNEVIKKRFAKVAQPAHLAAYLLHPKYQGQFLSGAQIEEAKIWLKEKNPEFLTTVISFEAQDAPFPASYFDPGATEAPPLSWWKGIDKRCSLPSGFMQLMKQLHTAVASSSSIERVFSSYGLIQTKLRNRLGNDKASKLVFCHRLLRGSQEIDY